MFSGCGPGSQCCLEVWSRAFVHAIDGCLVPTLVNRCARHAHIATKGFDPDLAEILKAVSNCLRWGGDWNGDPIDRVMITPLQ